MAADLTSDQMRIDRNDYPPNSHSTIHSMRIDFVITELNVGGAERCLTEVAIAMSVAGNRVRVFSIGPLPVGNQSQLLERLQENGIEVQSGNASSSRQMWSASRRLANFFEESVPDVCQTFLFHANVLGSWVARRCGVPTIIGGVRVAEANCLRCYVEAKAMRHMKQVVCVSQAVADFSHVYLGCTDEQTRVIPNGVDVQRFASGDVFDVTSLDWPANAQLILFVGRMHPQKGIDLLQRQFETFISTNHRESDQCDRRLLMIGSGPLADEVDAWCHRIGQNLAKRLPWQSDIAPMMRRCQLLLLPSRYEGMPNVVMEAMAAARPVVCSQVEGIAELLSNDPRQTFPIGDENQMALLVNEILSNPTLAQSLGESNQATVQSKFSIDAMADAFQSLYREFERRDE
ncbi:glycosyltransferase family 4 protein [Rubripirellula amarantea]|nr:glycosyltransferase family 4 protein [Rubripirellula amarantea]